MQCSAKLMTLSVFDLINKLLKIISNVMKLNVKVNYTLEVLHLCGIDFFSTKHFFKFFISLKKKSVRRY